MVGLKQLAVSVEATRAIIMLRLLFVPLRIYSEAWPSFATLGGFDTKHQMLYVYVILALTRRVRPRDILV
jgi:hypothetical protein